MKLRCVRCRYEERSEFYTGKPYWFTASTDNVLFYLSQDPMATPQISDGFCFPELGATEDEQIAVQVCSPLLATPCSPPSLSPRAHPSSSAST